MRRIEKKFKSLSKAQKNRLEFALQSPLVRMSGLICKLEVMHRKCDEMLSMWGPCLLVMTCDNNMHLFEIPVIADVNIGELVDAVFQALVPPVEMPTQNAVCTKRLIT